MSGGGVSVLSNKGVWCSLIVPSGERGLVSVRQSKHDDGLKQTGRRMLSHAVSMAVTVGLLCGTMVAGVAAYGVETGQRGAQGTTETGQRVAGDADNALAGKNDGTGAETGSQTDSANPTEAGDSSESAGQAGAGKQTGSEGQAGTGDPSSNQPSQSGDSSEPSEGSQPSGGKQPMPSAPDGEGTGSSADTKQKVDFDEHTVKNTVSPSGTAINLFDYWLTNQSDADSPDILGHKKPEHYQTNGINKGHALKFVMGGGFDESGVANQYTGSGQGAKRGILNPNLGADGYPVLSGNPAGDTEHGENPKESLSYLFNPSVNTAGRAVYPGVKDLLQVDGEGYYYYNSYDNFASYNETDNAFKLYDAGGMGKGGTGVVNGGQFFPFNTAEQVFSSTELTTNSKDEYVLKGNGTNSRAEFSNHWFGLTMSTRFIQQDGGTVVGSNGSKKDMTYRFSGDDDTWIFIDGVLVGDVGGIHDPSGVEINFRTGEVTLGKTIGTDGNFQGTTTTTIRKMFEKAEAENLAKWGTGDKSNTFAEGTYHTLKMFYMERGNYDSNLSLKFNLVTAPESQVVKVDQAGNPIPGVSFELYGQKPEGDDKWIDVRKSPVAEGTTDEDGVLVLVDPDTEMPISFDDIYRRGEERNGGYTRYRLEEVNLPDGYRSVRSVLLEYHPASPNDTSHTFGGYVTSVPGDEWQTGAYANAGVLVSAPHDIYKANDSGDKEGKPISEEDLRKGTLFAVVLKYEGEGQKGLTTQRNWKVVSGDSLNGWTMEPEDGLTGIGDIAEAARGKKVHSFAVTSSGSYQTTIEELPGDVSTYYSMIMSTNGNEGDTKFTVAYYFTEGALSDATEANTHRLYINGTDAGNTYQRRFSVNLHVPNIKNALYVQKVDEDYKPITDHGENLTAEFTLYEESQVKDGKLIEGAKPYDTVTTRKSLSVNGKCIMDSAAAFPSDGKVLEEGTYYLKEVKAPDGYTLRDGLTKVVVTSDGVYADAGQDNDGVRVRSGVGQLVRTMARFATSDQIDATLSDIIAELRTGGEPSYSQQKGWQYSWNDESSAGSMNLSYKNSAALLEYGVTGSTDQRPSYEDVTLMNDVGWSTLAITQHYDDYCIQTGDEGIKGCVSSINKQHLVDAQNKPISLNNLFTGSTTIQVANHAGPELPATGGMGARTLLWGGLLLAGISLCGLTYVRRRW